MTHPRLTLSTSGPIAPAGTVRGTASLSVAPATENVRVDLCAVDLVHGTKIHRTLATAAIPPRAGDHPFAIDVPIDATRPSDLDEPIEASGFEVVLRIDDVGRATCFVDIAR